MSLSAILLICEKLTTHDFYAVPRDCGLAGEIGEGATVTWRSPIGTKIPGEQHRSRRSFRVRTRLERADSPDAARAHVGK